MGIILTKFTELATSIFGLIKDEKIVFTFMFFAMLMGTFAMFKSLLTFAFKSNSGFNAKSINVMSFMLSFIGTTGIAFMYNKSPTTFIYVFGGGFGYFLVLFLVVFVFKIMHMFAEEFKDEKGMLGKGPLWIFFMILASLLSAYLLLGYTGKILVGLGCEQMTVSGGVINGGWDVETRTEMVCNSNQNGTFLYAKVYNLVSGIIGFLLPFAIIFGIWMLIKYLGKDKDEDHNSHKDPFAHDDKHDQEHAEHVSHLVKEFDHSMHDAAKTFEDQSKSLNNLQRILNEGGRGGH